MKTLRDMDVAGERVIMRVDFNVPLDDETGEITNDRRIRMALPTIEHAVENGARVILMSHLGRPKGQRDEKLSLSKVADRLSELIDADVSFAPDCVGGEAASRAESLDDGDILVLENLRFHAGEKGNDEDFARQLAELADLYVNDAFGTAHRAHASTAGVPGFLPGCIGFLMEDELENLQRPLENPDHPYVAIVGGAKVSDKLQVIENLLDRADNVMIGGAMAYTFLKQQDHSVGDSLVEDDMLDTAGSLLDRASDKIVLPEDHVCGDEIAAGAQVNRCGIDIPDGWIGLDLGSKTLDRYEAKIKSASLVTWNGPVGYFEFESFAEGCRRIAQAMAESDADTIVGGGETAEAVDKAGLYDSMTHVSTGGGASLSVMAGQELPALAALQD